MADFFESTNLMFANSLVIFHKKACFKIPFKVKCTFVKHVLEENLMLRSDTWISQLAKKVKNEKTVLQEAQIGVQNSVDQYESKGNGWVLDSISHCDWTVVMYQRIQYYMGRGACGNLSTLLDQLKNKKA